MTRADPQMKLRLPPDLKQQLEERAAAAGRSLNAEVVERLRQSFSDTRPLSQEAKDSILRGLDELIAYRMEQAAERTAQEKAEAAKSAPPRAKR